MGTPLSDPELLAILEDLLKDFPFVDPKEEEKLRVPREATASHSVGLSILLTPMARAAVAFVPLHVARAYVAGTGKSYIFNISHGITNGTRCPVIAAGKNEEETEKRMSAVILAGVLIICIDNVNGILSSDLICQAISEETVCPRILGKSETPPVANVFTVFANGNNIRVHADLTRRTLFCVMDAGLDAMKVQARTFAADPMAMVLADRGKYIAACLTILRAHHLAGYPGAKGLSSIVGFDDWTRVVRGALVWLGKADPVDSLAVGRADDPQRNERQTFVEAFATLFGVGEHHTRTVRQMVDDTKLIQKEDTYNDNEACASLWEELKEFADYKGDVNTKKVGHWLRGFQHETFDTKRLMSRTVHKVQRWYVSDQPF